MKRKRGSSMQPSKRACALAPEEKRTTGVKQFRSVVRVLDGIKPGSEDKGVCFASSGVFDMLADDSVVRVVDFLLELAPGRAEPPGLVEVALSTRRFVVHFALTCRRIASVIKTCAARQQAEAIARGATKIEPLNLNTAYPFTEQMKSEMLSCSQLKMLKYAQDSFACHCAKACCQKYQSAFNREIRKGLVFKPSTARSSPRLVPLATNPSCVVPVLESCSLLAATPNGDVAFAYVRKRLSKIGVHGDSRGRRFEETLLQVKMSGTPKPAFPVKASTEVSMPDMSSPLTMRAANDGSAAVYICAKHSVDEEVSPFSSAFVWQVGGETLELKQPTTSAPSVCLSAQDAWFAHCPTGAWTHVAVAWSTDFVHPSGHHTGSNASPNHGPAYLVATYAVEDGVAELYDVSSIQERVQLIECSPTKSGTSAVALVKTHPAYNRPSKRMVVMLSITDDVVVPVSGGSHSSTGPLAAALSPTGDCAVTISRTRDSIVADVLVRTAHKAFTPMQTIDLSAWISLREASDLPSGSDLVKAALGASFSHCGRFVTIIDRHPHFGESPNNHGVVVIDTALRMDQYKALRPFPMFPTDDQAPRSIQWTKNGIWMCPPGTDEVGAIGSRGGALMLYCPHAASLM